MPPHLTQPQSLHSDRTADSTDPSLLVVITLARGSAPGPILWEAFLVAQQVCSLFLLRVLNSMSPPDSIRGTVSCAHILHPFAPGGQGPCSIQLGSPLCARCPAQSQAWQRSPERLTKLNCPRLCCSWARSTGWVILFWAGHTGLAGLALRVSVYSFLLEGADAQPGDGGTWKWPS